jgi:hypothetical protein
MGMKKVEFDADFGSVEKGAKNQCEKRLLTKKRQKNGVFLLLLLCAKVFDLYIFGVNFFAFFQQFRTRHRILRFMVPISN